MSRGRDFKVTIEFAAKIRMKAIEEMMRGVMGRCSLDQEKRALDALRVLDIVLRESASERYAEHVQLRILLIHTWFVWRLIQVYALYIESFRRTLHVIRVLRCAEAIFSCETISFTPI